MDTSLQKSVSFLDAAWCGLDWSPWVPLGQGYDSRLISNSAGLYRIKVHGSDALAYIGETGRSLKGRVGDLRRGILATDMPFNDPHTAAPNLWAWRVESGYEYEVSVTPSPLGRRERKALECFLLWQYRLGNGRSTLCNHGHFHPLYTKSTNRSGNRRGTRRDGGAQLIASTTSMPPLRQHGDISSSEWMGLR
jgi:hypothetical protein